MPAYAMIDVPEPGSTDVPRFAVAARAVPLVAVEGVVARELVAHLVGDVVDRVGVTDGVGDSGASLAFSTLPTTPRPAMPPPLVPSAMWPMS